MMKSTLRVDFTNVFTRSFYSQRSKSVKIQSCCQYIFAFSHLHVKKAACKMLVKLTLGWTTNVSSSSKLQCNPVWNYMCKIYLSFQEKRNEDYEIQVFIATTSVLLDLVNPDWFSRLDHWMFRKSSRQSQVRGKIN